MWGGATQYVPLRRPCYAFPKTPGDSCFYSCTCMGLGSGARCHSLLFSARLEPQSGDWDSDKNATGTACEAASSRLITSPHASCFHHRGLPEPGYIRYVPLYVGCAPAPGPRRPGQQLHERLRHSSSPCCPLDQPTVPVCLTSPGSLYSTCLSFGLKSRTLAHPRRIGSH